jgi:hypothetical protein
MPYHDVEQSLDNPHSLFAIPVLFSRTRLNAMPFLLSAILDGEAEVADSGKTRPICRHDISSQSTSFLARPGKQASRWSWRIRGGSPGQAHLRPGHRADATFLGRHR